MTLKWTSNKATVADRAFTIARVTNGQIELMPDPSTGKFVGVYIDTTPASDPAIPGEIAAPVIFEVEAFNG